MTSTKPIGEILREERLKHRLSLSDLSKRTRIRLSYLEALEDNQFDQLPAAIFVKGYIRAYGQVFGFDHQPLLGLLRRDYKESAKGTLVPREFLKPVLKKQPLFQRVTGMVLGLMVIFAVLLIYVGVQWYRFSQPPAVRLTSPEADGFVAAQVEVKGSTEPDVLLTVNSQPVALQPDGSFSTIVFLPREGVNTISIEATDRQGKKSLIQRTVRVKF